MIHECKKSHDMCLIFFFFVVKHWWYIMFIDLNISTTVVWMLMETTSSLTLIACIDYSTIWMIRIVWILLMKHFILAQINCIRIVIIVQVRHYNNIYPDDQIIMTTSGVTGDHLYDLSPYAVVLLHLFSFN